MQYNRRQLIKYIAGDFLTVNAGWLCFNVARYFSLPPDFVSGTFTQWYTDPGIILGQLLVPPAMIILYAISGYYNLGNSPAKSRLDEFINTFIVSFIAMLGIYFIALINDKIPERLKNYELMAILYVCLFLPTYITRLTISTHQWRRVRTGRFSVNALLIGSGDDAIRQAVRLTGSSPRSGLRIAGVIDPTATVPSMSGDLPVFPESEIALQCSRLGIRALILMPQAEGMNASTRLINRLYSLDLPLYITPDLMHLMTMRPRMSSVATEPLIDITNANIPPATANLKRLGDIVVSALVLIAIMPLLAIIAVIVKCDTKGPVLYRQKRIGYHKKGFYINKFRTMRTDAEEAGPRLSAANDPRITRSGRILRKYRLDELPQFWNVLIGEMSLVGPRPEREYYIRRIVERVPAYSLIHQVRPGITSWGMVKFGYASNVDEMIERLRYDLLYIENVSFSVDLKILFHTVNTVITGKGV